uniref:GGDEF domain-containing protein n=1 Tax=Agathobacter sp. TaxID=2021311 RepID=UPI004055C2D7
MQKGKRLLLKKIMHFLVCLLFLGILVYPVYSAMSIKEDLTEELIVDAGWNVIVNGTLQEDVILSETEFDSLGKGDSLVMITKLPAEDIFLNPIMKVSSLHSVVDVYLDNVLVYSYGKEYYEENRLVGYGAHFIELPDDYGGMEIRIEYIGTENNSFDKVSPITIDNGNYRMYKQMKEAAGVMALSLFLIVFGVIGIVMAFFVGSAYFVRTMSISTFSYLVGVWTLCSGNLISFVLTNISKKTYIEYCALFFLAIPFLFYFYERMENGEYPKWVKVYYKVLLAAQSLFTLASYLLQSLKLISFPTLLPLVYVFMGLTVVYLILLFGSDYARTGRINVSVSASFILATIILAIEIFNYAMLKNTVGFKANEYNIGILAGAVLMVFSLFRDFSHRIGDAVAKEAQQKLLLKMAYTDELTGLANRRKCEDELEELLEKRKSFAVVSLDLNSLKQMNDTYGHETGDIAIKAFADVLHHVFSDEGSTVGRIGGDEFMVIIPEQKKETIEKRLGEMRTRMLRYNKKGGVVQLNTAYGYAFSHECNVQEDVHEVYRLADERMYICKRNMKKENVR